MAIHHLTDEQRTPEICLAAVKQHGQSIQYLTDEQRTPEVCLVAVQQDGEAIGVLTPDQCAQPSVSEWIEAHWDQCAQILGQQRALGLAQAMVSAAQQQETHDQGRERERFAG